MSSASKPAELMLLKIFTLLKPGDDKVIITLKLFLVKMPNNVWCLTKPNRVCDDLVNTLGTC